MLKTKSFIAAFIAYTLDKSSRPCSGGCAKEKEKRNLDPDKTGERLRVVNLECVDNSVECLDVHRKPFLLRSIKPQARQLLP
jgi:hypothetical protein